MAETQAEGDVLDCEKCGGVMEISFFGEMRDKRAVCPYCGAQVDLPDTYHRVRRKRKHKKGLWGSQTVESVVVETRSDHPPDSQPLLSPSELDEIHDLLREVGEHGLDEEIIEKLKDQGIVILPGERITVRTEIRAEDRGLLSNLLRRLGGDLSLPVELSPYELVRLAGKPLSPEERFKCSKCDATVPRSATRCPWCNASLFDGE